MGNKCKHAKRVTRGETKHMLCKLTGEPCVYMKFCRKTGQIVNSDKYTECKLLRDEGK